MTRYVLQPGRCITRDGQPFAQITRSTNCAHIAPADLDAFARRVVTWANAAEALRTADDRLDAFGIAARVWGDLNDD